MKKRIYQIPYPQRVNLPGKKTLLKISDNNTGSFLEQLNSEPILEHLATHFNVLWLTGIYKQQKGMPFEVENHLEIDPSWGSLDDFKKLVKGAKGHDLEIWCDLVINHSAESAVTIANINRYQLCQGCSSSCGDRNCFSIGEGYPRVKRGFWKNGNQSGVFFGTAQHALEKQSTLEWIANQACEIASWGVKGFRVDMALDEKVGDGLIYLRNRIPKHVMLLGEIQPGQVLKDPRSLEYVYHHQWHGALWDDDTRQINQEIAQLTNILKQPGPRPVVLMSHHDHPSTRKAYGENEEPNMVLTEMLPCSSSRIISYEVGYEYDWENSGLDRSQFDEQELKRQLPMFVHDYKIQWEKNSKYQFTQRLLRRRQEVENVLGSEQIMHVLSDIEPYASNIAGYGLEGNGNFVVVLGNRTNDQQVISVLNQEFKLPPRGYVIQQVDIRHWKGQQLQTSIGKSLGHDARHVISELGAVQGANI